MHSVVVSLQPHTPARAAKPRQNRTPAVGFAVDVAGTVTDGHADTVRPIKTAEDRLRVASRTRLLMGYPLTHASGGRGTVRPVQGSAMAKIALAAGQHVRPGVRAPVRRERPHNSLTAILSQTVALVVDSPS